MSGRLVVVGTGPGNPDQTTPEALAAIDASHVFFGYGPYLDRLTLRADQRRVASDNREELARAKDALHTAASGEQVCVVSGGDPGVFAMAAAICEAIEAGPPGWRAVDLAIVPGVTAMSGCWSQAGLPLVQGDDILSVLPGTLDEVDLSTRLNNTDGAVIMKVGRNLPKIRRALELAGRLDTAVYVERGTMANGRSMRLIDKADDVAPYFAIVLVPGWSTRP